MLPVAAAGVDGEDGPAPEDSIELAPPGQVVVQLVGVDLGNSVTLLLLVQEKFVSNRRSCGPEVLVVIVIRMGLVHVLCVSYIYNLKEESQRGYSRFDKGIGWV